MAEKKNKKTPQTENAPEKKNPVEVEAAKAAGAPENEVVCSAEEYEKLKSELSEQKDLFLRKAAEFENYKKRTQRETERIGLESRASVIKQLLPAIDNFNRAMSTENADDADFRKGVEITVKQFLDGVKKLGVEEINPAGEQFDPEYHYAVSRIDDETLEKNTVAEVMQCGYKMGSIVIRPAMVSVANCD